MQLVQLNMVAHGALLLPLLVAIAAFPRSAEGVGVCYGMNGDNLPSPAAVVQLYQSNGINGMRLYAPDGNTLQALGGTGIGLILDVPNDSLQSFAADSSAAAGWVSQNVLPYVNDVSFRYIAVGNEVSGGDVQNIVPAMQNVQNALSAAGVQGVQVSTSVSTAVLAVSYPPSAGSFDSSMGPIVSYLASTGAPLLANVYPYFAYVNSGGSIQLDYALFTASGTVVQDGQYAYQNLFDAIVDALYSALGNAGGGNVGIVVSESGWPSAGGTAATTDNARTYNQNLINHVGGGTPRRPGAIETYIFAMFNEDEKSGDPTEQNFGLFFPNEQPVYSINFN